MKKVTELTAELAMPIIQDVGCTLWDVEYVREAGTWFLRVFIDNDDGVDIEQCETVSRKLSDLLDEIDPIESSYVLEVGSAGMGRSLKKPEHFAKCMGETVEINLYRPLNGSKEYIGVLSEYNNGDVTIENDEGKTTFIKKDISRVRLHIDF